MDAETLVKTIAGEKPTLVDFFATWCGPCKMMHPVIEELQKECSKKMNVLKVDVDIHTALSAEFAVQSVPTLILFKKDKVLWRHSGAMSLPTLKEQLCKALENEKKSCKS